ncbi:MAG: adenine deaminase [Sphaerochaetaceae bacterium]|nr:adenine deaminase [Sphaerochaetaceae bacterium]
MKILNKEERKEIVDCAMGRAQCDLRIINAKIFNVFTKEIYPGEIYIKNGYIAYIEQRKEYFGEGKSKKDYDATNQIVVPGFIDSHMHIESSMLTPQNFSTLAIPRGTTTVVTDPHEIGNVMGMKGIDYMIEAGKHTYMNQFILAPSCVPAAPGLEKSGAEFNAPEIEEILDKENVLGIAEVMDYYGVTNNSSRMVDILDVTEKKGGFMQGHYFGENPREFSAYLCAGPQSNHEFYTGKDALQAIRNGMVVDARDSSFAKNIHSIVKVLKGIDTFDRLTLCTDDREVEQLMEEGHLDQCARSAISSGLSFGDTIRSITIIPAQQFHIKHLGAIAPGYVANLNFIEGDKEKIKVNEVFFEGILVAKENKMIKNYLKYENQIEKENTVFVDNFDFSNLKIKAPVENGKIKTRVIEYEDFESLLTKEKIVELSVKDGYLSLEDHKELNFIAVINRHPNCDNFFVGVVEKFHLNEGALAGTVSHDSHNLTVVFNNIEDAKTAINEIKKINGGIVYVNKGKVQKVEFPIAGLLSNLNPKELVFKVKDMKKLLKEKGIKNENPIMRLATAALPVAPALKITDMGLVDAINQRFVSLFLI